MRGWPALAALLLAASAQAQSYRRTEIIARDGSTRCLYWNDRSLTWNLDAAGSAKTPGDTERTAVQTAFATWQTLSNSCSDFAVTEGPRLTNPPIGKNTQANNVVAFREVTCDAAAPPADACHADGSCANVYHCWDHGDFTIALTTNTYSVTTAVIVDSDIELNAAPHFDGTSFLFTTVSAPPCTDAAQSTSCVATDVQNTMTHEIGHLFGFDHVDDEASTMAATAAVGDTGKRVIDRGTADGFCLAYPRGQPATPCDELATLRRKIVARNVGTPGFGCAAGGEAWSALPLALFAWALARARRRR